MPFSRSNSTSAGRGLPKRPVNCRPLSAGAVGASRRRNLQARVVAVHDAPAAPQLVASEPVATAYCQVVGALVAMLRCLNQQVTSLEQ
jgi:hypothetical protein